MRAMNVLVLAMAWVLGTTPASAQGSFRSNGPVTIVVPYAAGGPSDGLLRPLAPQLQAQWGQPVIIDNRPGANGTIGVQYVQSRPADGKTLLFHITALIQNIALYKNLPYDPFRDLAPVVLLGRQNNALVVPEDSPYKTVQDLVAAIKANPEKFAYGSYGNGSTTHIYGKLFAFALGVDIPHLAFKGEGPVLTEILAGRLPFSFTSAASAAVRAKDGSMRVLAQTGPARTKFFPDVPTMAEVGYPQFELTGWWGIFMPSGAPKSIRDQIANDLRAVLRQPELQARLDALALEPSASTPEQVMAEIKHETEQWVRITRQFNISLD